MTDLFQATRVHDLPPKWDGRVVDWSEWKPSGAVVICPPPKPRKCEACKQVAPVDHATGTVHPVAGETFERDRVKRTKSGREYVAGRVPVAAWPVIALHAFRCTGCGFDQVRDQRTDEWWDLDPTDYEDEGSTQPT